MVVTANGDVQTNEEAHEDIIDLRLFETVQFLADTPAVLSLGKLLEEHGYSYGWASGQRPQLTKQGKKTFCRTDNFVPFVIPGQHRQNKTCLHHVQSDSEVTNRHQETGARLTE